MNSTFGEMYEQGRGTSHIDDATSIGVFKGLDMAAWLIIKEMVNMDPEWAERTIRSTLETLLEERKE